MRSEALATRLCRVEVGMALLALALATGLSEARGAEVAEDFQAAQDNTRELRHAVSVASSAPDVLTFTVTRDFEARQPNAPVELDLALDLPADAVVTSFAFRSGPSWRPGRLAPNRAPWHVVEKRKDQPWASLAYSNPGQAQLVTPVFRAAGRVQVRYTIWAQGEPSRDGYRWVYCGDEPSATALPAPELALASGQTALIMRPDPDAPSCTEIRTSVAARSALTARYGVYRIGRRAWWWRVELLGPSSLVPTPAPPEPGPVVFVLDGSRSQQSRGGLATQLAIVEGYLANAPKAQVELVVASRTARRVFGRLVPAAEVGRAIPRDFVQQPLRNGSFLDAGIAVATDVLAGVGPGRIVLMTDGELRSRFDRAAARATLGHAPAGTIVHVIYPGNWTNGEVIHTPPGDGVGELGVALGGAVYQVGLNPSGKQALRADEVAALLARLVRPDRIESLELHDAGHRGHPDWPDYPDDPWLSPVLSQHELLAGEGLVWSAVSPSPPPSRLSVNGWIWDKRVELSLAPDRAFERRLPRLATVDQDLMTCGPHDRHTDVARAAGFLAPGLEFLVPGSGDRDEAGYAGGYDPDCDVAGLGGHGTWQAPKRGELPPDIDTALSSCGLIRDPGGRLHATLEIEGEEILDVRMEGGEAEQRRCAGEALWGLSLPAGFNHLMFKRLEYEVALSAKGGATAK